MEMQEFFDTMTKMMRDAEEEGRRKAGGLINLRLGELIEKLTNYPLNARCKFDDDRNPGEFGSWRGVYAELYIDRANDNPEVTVDDVLTNAYAANGGVFQGYKGGDFVMSEDTRLWADTYGDYNSIAIHNVMMENDIAQERGGL